MNIFQIRHSPQNNLVLDGRSLSYAGIWDYVHNKKKKIDITSSAFKAVQQSHDFLLRDAEKTPIYGVNTGFGPMINHIIGTRKLNELQYNLVRGHAVGVGEPVSNVFVLAAMLVRLNTLLQGRSGVSVELLHTLTKFINYRVIPVVPTHGAVGTSGDLVQLAHIALSLIGEGQVSYEGKQEKTSAVLQKLGITPHALGIKEGLALINGTSMMSGIASLLVYDAQRIINIAIRAGALALELTESHTDMIDPELHKTRPHPGQERVAAALRELLLDSQRLVNRARNEEDVRVEDTDSVHTTTTLLQEVYSLRCIPQILGPLLETAQNTAQVVTREINSTTDNPIIDIKNRRYLHGGNFHGDYVAVALDQMKAGLIKLTLLSERRINFFLNQRINMRFPPFLNLMQPGLTMGLQGMQFVATSTAAHSQSFAFPHNVHSISTNADNQDVVSMGTDAALITHTVVENAYTLLALELVTLSQAMELYSKDNALFSSAAKELVETVRTHVSPVYEDRSLTNEIESLKNALKYDDDFDV